MDAYPSTYLPGSAPGISYENYQKSLACLSPLILLCFTKRQKQKENDMAQCPPKYAFIFLIIIGIFIFLSRESDEALYELA